MGAGAPHFNPYDRYDDTKGDDRCMQHVSNNRFITHQRQASGGRTRTADRVSR
jgi:hypothetical protein